MGSRSNFKSFVVGFATVAALSLVSQPAFADHTTTNASKWVYGWSDSAWSNYDSRGTGINDGVDWPAQFMFGNNAEVDVIKNTLCLFGPNGPYSRPYCNVGLQIGMQVIETDGDWGWDDDAGFKLGIAPSTDLLLGCNNVWREHMRLYGPRPNNTSVQDRFYNPWYGYFVVGTSHLDYNDSPGCQNRYNGYPDIAANWFQVAIDPSPYFDVYPNWDWIGGNSSPSHVGHPNAASNPAPNMPGCTKNPEGPLGILADGIWCHVYGNDFLETHVYSY
jgi:hypothetical protein